MVMMHTAKSSQTAGSLGVPAFAGMTEWGGSVVPENRGSVKYRNMNRVHQDQGIAISMDCYVDIVHND